MSVLEILKYPNPILRNRGDPVETIDEKIRKLVQNMTETMYAAPGIGLAAPQVGESLRVITVDLARNGEGLITMVNPNIISSEGEYVDEEGCLSVPDFKDSIRRKQKIVVAGLDIDGKNIQLTAEGLLAAAFQHEIDHLNGILIIDKVSRLKKDAFKKKLKKKKEI
ncbi:MAG: peptide deformylase [Thermodesulfobacteriota bacterium]|nr:peptide deformylase [Thermodesulfobacteriota bacterium]